MLTAAGVPTLDEAKAAVIELQVTLGGGPVGPLRASTLACAGLDDPHVGMPEIARLACGLFAITGLASHEAMVVGLACPIAAPENVEASKLYALGSVFRHAFGSVVGMLTEEMVSTTATAIGNMRAQHTYSGPALIGKSLAAQIIASQGLPQRVAPGVPPPGPSPDTQTIDLTSALPLTPRMKMLMELKRELQNMQAAPRGLAAAFAAAETPPAPTVLEGLDIFRPSDVVEWEVGSDVQLCINLGGNAMMRKIHTVATANVLEVMDPQVDIEGKAGAAVITGVRADIARILASAKRIYALANPTSAPLAFHVRPTSIDDAMGRLLMVLRLVEDEPAGGQQHVNVVQQAAGKPPPGASVALDVASAEVGDKHTVARNRAVAAEVMEPMTASQTIWMMLATEQVRGRPVAECQRIIDLQGTPTAQHSARAFFISNAKVTVKLPGEVPSQLFSARTVLLADVRLTVQSVVGIVNQAQRKTLSRRRPWASSVSRSHSRSSSRRAVR